MIAPSEKHLEDWIVAHPEKVMPEYWGYDLPAFPMIDRVVKRQPPFPCGRPDLIIEARHDIAIVELKKGVIDSDTVTQCYRYLYDLQRIAYLRYLLETDCHQNEYSRVRIPSIGDGLWGIVIGHSIESDNLRIACRAMHISPLLYDFDGADYHFRGVRLNVDSLDPAIDDWAHGAVGAAVWHAMKRYSEWSDVNETTPE